MCRRVAENMLAALVGEGEEFDFVAFGEVVGECAELALLTSAARISRLMRRPPGRVIDAEVFCGAEGRLR